MSAITRIRRQAIRIPAAVNRRRIGDKPFCIIADNCWGGQIYQHLGRRYNSPFVGVSIRANDYLRLLSDLSRYLALDLTFDGRYDSDTLTGTRYPIGCLNDVDVHCIHYPDESEAAENWARRRDRMDLAHLFVAIDVGRFHANADHLRDFLALPFAHKVAFSAEPMDGAVYVPAWTNDGAEMFRRTQQVFDAVQWINGHSPQPRRIDSSLYAAASA